MNFGQDTNIHPLHPLWAPISTPIEGKCLFRMSQGSKKDQLCRRCKAFFRWQAHTCTEYEFIFILFCYQDQAGKKPLNPKAKTSLELRAHWSPFLQPADIYWAPPMCRYWGPWNESDESSSPKNKHPPPHPIYGWWQKEVKGSGAFKGGRPGFKSKLHHWDFPAGPVAKTPHSQCKGTRFDPWSGN